MVFLIYLIVSRLVRFRVGRRRRSLRTLEIENAVLRHQPHPSAHDQTSVPPLRSDRTDRGQSSAATPALALLSCHASDPAALAPPAREMEVDLPASTARSPADQSWSASRRHSSASPAQDGRSRCDSTRRAPGPIRTHWRHSLTLGCPTVLSPETPGPSSDIR
jgi:hypothetical protein